MTVVNNWASRSMQAVVDGPDVRGCRTRSDLFRRHTPDRPGLLESEPIIEQEIEYTDFLLDEVRLYASVEPVDETGKKKRVIILLPSEY